MQKETEEAIGFFVTFLSLVHYNWRGRALCFRLVTPMHEQRRNWAEDPFFGDYPFFNLCLGRI